MTRSRSTALLAVLLAAASCAGPDDRAAAAGPPTVHLAAPATLELPPVPDGPSRLRVLQYGLEPGSRPRIGQCAVLVLDPVNHVSWRIEASQAWDSTEVRADTTFVRHTAIGDYVPARLEPYGMSPGQVIRVDCAAYGVLGLAKSGG